MPNISSTLIQRDPASGLYYSSPVITKVANEPVKISDGYIGKTREEVIRMIVINTYVKHMRLKLCNKMAVSWSK